MFQYVGSASTNASCVSLMTERPTACSSGVAGSFRDGSTETTSCARALVAKNGKMNGAAQSKSASSCTAGGHHFFLSLFRALAWHTIVHRLLQAQACHPTLERRSLQAKQSGSATNAWPRALRSVLQVCQDLPAEPSLQRVLDALRHLLRHRETRSQPPCPWLIGTL